MYLTSIDNIVTNPAWLNGVKPDSTGKTDGAVSVTIIVNDRGNGEVDAFYMYFYAYNWGGIFLGEDVDDHVGVGLPLACYGTIGLIHLLLGLGTQHDSFPERDAFTSLVQPAQLR